MATLKEVIERIDSSKLNAYDTEIKVRWLDTINRQALLQGYKLPNKEYVPLSTNDMETVLLIEEPYSNIYDYYVYAQIDLMNNEIANFNNNIMLYNNEWTEYLKYMIREGYLSTQPTFKNAEP